ncbi:hypothetical protein GGR57DRAFT_395952 [Xylariaceae sp. FL1272]|nr:hypothetical protein GGR57DRAFT_395952 [Xylariaceae sp. FL1272]
MEEDENHNSQIGGEESLEQMSLIQLPQTPPAEVSSLLDTTRIKNEDDYMDSIDDEDRVRAHLQDVESSFLPPLSPTIPVDGPDAGIDDSYLFDAVPRKAVTPAPPGSKTPKSESKPPTPLSVPLKTEPRSSVSPIAAPTSDETHSPPPAPLDQPADEADQSLFSEPQPNVSYHENETTQTTSEAPSSPTPANAGRAASKATSVAHDVVDQEPPSEYENTDPSIHQDTSFVTSNPTLHHKSSDTNMNRLSIGTAASGSSLHVAKRPKFLRSRNTSQRSSTSSFLTNDDVESDVTVSLGADYALQSGGAAPAFGLQRSASNTLARSISMGSILSGFDDSADLGANGLETLEEVESPVRERYPDTTFATPKAKNSPLSAPTDTVIARHVQNVEVPESLAREYKTKGGLSTPIQSQRREYTPAPGTARGRNMTLKEQSSTIERLSKENFDLKLKVMFLSDRLDRISQDNIKETISENVELKMSLAVMQRDNKMLRRQVKELEKKLHEDEGRPSTARTGTSSDGRTTPTFGAASQAAEEEVYILREQIEEYVREIERLKTDNLTSEVEKRKLAETVKTMGDRAAQRFGDSQVRQDETDLWKDLLDQETVRREQADEENQKLRDEIFRLKHEANGSTAPGGAMHHTTNIYNITRKQRPASPSRSRPMTSLSGEVDPTIAMSQSSTLVEDLRRESDRLRHENTELQRAVSSQTAMLTSRIREKETLSQEIEDLKLALRRGGPAPSTLDSLLDRSASRSGARDRPISRGSGQSRLTMTVEDPEREELENKMAAQRDKINELKLKNQELQRELQNTMTNLEVAMKAKTEAEAQVADLYDENQNNVNDIIIIQKERDEVLEDLAEKENEFNMLREEAQEELDKLGEENDALIQDIEHLRFELQDRSENFESLQAEMRNMTESLIALEDDHIRTEKRIEQLEKELADSNKELEDLEGQLLESNEKGQRLEVQLESGQGEIAFLREEQEGDKVRIGDLEQQLSNAEHTLKEEHDRARELDQRLANERKQREVIANREKEEVQQVVNELNREASAAKEEVRIVRKTLSRREVEATEWKERLVELENNLREALGDLNGTRSSLLGSIAKLQRELENTVRELDTAKNSVLEKDRIIKQRDNLLETHGLESRKISEMLEKEKQAHRNTKNQFETFQRTHHHVSRTVTSQDTRIVELETTRASDRKRIAQLEHAFKEQLAERNNLLLVLWTRLSALCGSDWTHNNSLINGRALPSLESISTMLPGFSKNLLGAIKTIESMLGSFQSRIKSVERDLWKEYQTVESTLEARSKKLDRLETLVRSGVAAGNLDAQNKITQLETSLRALKIENATLQRAHDARTRGMGMGLGFPSPSNLGTRSKSSRENLIETGSPSPSVPTGPHGRESKIPQKSKTGSQIERTGTMSRTVSSSSQQMPNTQELERVGTAHGGGSASGGSNMGGSGGRDEVLMMRLREMEYKIRQEREAREMDRAAARQRIRDSERQNNELQAELVRVRRKAEVGGE